MDKVLEISKHLKQLNLKIDCTVIHGGITDGAIIGVCPTKTTDSDSMSELGEMESLTLQMAMDRLSKLMATLSNLMKKISDTASAITQNLK